jgi:hypothetical protein
MSMSIYRFNFNGQDLEMRHNTVLEARELAELWMAEQVVK